MAIFVGKDVDIYYEVHGEGEPLLLIAGLASDSQSWLPVLEGLAEKFQVIIFDNRGCGRSIPEDLDFGVREMAEDVSALLEHLDISKVNILGHSLGGFVAQEFAVAYPQKVKRLILEATSVSSPAANNQLFVGWVEALKRNGADREWFLEIFKAIFSQEMLADEKLVELMLVYSVDYPYPQSVAAFIQQVYVIKKFDFSTSVQQIRAETLVVCGEKDVLFAPAESEAAFAEIAGCRYEIIAGAGHALHVERAAEFTRLVCQFLQQV